MNWPIVELGKIFDISSSKRVLQKQWKDSGVPFYRAREIVKLARHGVVKNDLYISEELFEEYSGKYGAPVAGDLMVSAVGTLGACYVVQPEDRFYYKDASVLRFHPSSEVDSRYMQHAFKSNRVLEQINSGSGSTVGTFTISRAKKTKIPLPPLTEQKRIAAILDATDELRAKRREAIAQLDLLLHSTFLEMFGDPVSNPMGWIESEVGEVARCIVPGRDKPKSFTGHVPWITTEDLNHLSYTVESPKGIGLSTEEIEEVRARVIPKTSVIISCVGDLGVSSIAASDMVVNQQLHTFQCNDTALLPEFLMFYLPYREPWMRGRATQTTLPYMNKTTCNSIPIFVPEYSLQRRFANVVRKVDVLKKIHNLHLCKLGNLFKSLQHRVFSGEL